MGEAGVVDFIFDVPIIVTFCTVGVEGHGVVQGQGQRG